MLSLIMLNVAKTKKLHFTSSIKRKEGRERKRRRKRGKKARRKEGSMEGRRER